MLGFNELLFSDVYLRDEDQAEKVGWVDFQAEIEVFYRVERTFY